MSEEVKIKISQPMFEVGELEIFDNNIHSIVEEYSKMMFKERDQILTQRIIIKQEEEIERLKNDIKRITEITNQKIKIINDVREYIMTNGIHSDYGDKGIDDENKLLEILDKENE